MNGTTHSRVTRLLAAAALATVFPAFHARAAFANDRIEAEQLVEKARLTLKNFQCDETMGPMRSLLPKAHGVLVIPSLLKGAFVVGASGGSGVLLVRNEHGGAWSEPAFYTLGGGSFGAQIGGESSEVVLLAMTDRGVKSLLANSLKLGGDAGVAAGPVGVGTSAATVNLSADILSFSRSKGAYGGISLEGAVLAVRHDLNRAYYGREVSTVDVLINRNVSNRQGAGLARLVEETATAKSAMKGCPTGRMGERSAAPSQVASSAW